MSEHPTGLTFGQGLSPALQVGGAMGIASVSLGLLVFLGACFGWEATLLFSPLPTVLGGVGLLLTIVGAVRSRVTVDTQVLASLFVNAFGLFGGLLEMAAWLHWPVLGRGAM